MSGDTRDEYVTVELPVRLKRSELAKLNEAATRKLIGETPPADNGSEPRLGEARHRAARLLQINRSRATVVGTELFADPAWNMMLDLFVRGVDGCSTTVTSACIGADAPSTTALRHLAILVERGLVERRPSPDDHRMHDVRLTSEGYARMLTLLS